MKTYVCKNCDKISSVDGSSPRCPKCGYPLSVEYKYKPSAKKESFALLYTVAGLVIAIPIFLGVLLFRSCSSNDSSPKTPTEIVYNSSWDSSVRQVKSYLDRTLKDPDSYESIDWSEVVKQYDGTFIVRHKYRAKNSFGGYVVTNQIFTLSSDGEVIECTDLGN